MKRRIATTTVTLLACVIAAAPAAADKSTVKDEREETAALRENGRVDIVRASAGHFGSRLEHTVVVREQIKRSRKRERPLIGINLRGSNTSDPEYLVYGDGIFKNRPQGEPLRVADATLRAQGASWTYRFDPEAFPDGGLGRYGWVAFTTTKKALDVLPPNYYATHRP
jgi:hypothetical protein